MGKYILKRLLYIVLVFLILSFLMYLIYNMLPVDKAAAKASEEVKLSKCILAEALRNRRKPDGTLRSLDRRLSVL